MADKKTWKYVIQGEPQRMGDPWPPPVKVIADRHEGKGGVDDPMKCYLGDDQVAEVPLVSQWSRKERVPPAFA